MHMWPWMHDGDRKVGRSQADAVVGAARVDEVTRGGGVVAELEKISLYE